MKGIKFRTFVKWVIGVGISVLLIGGFVWSRSRWIPAGHVGVVYDASRGLLPEVIKPKRVFIGWRQQLYTYPTQLMNALYTQDPTAGEERSADGILITTNDNANTIFDVSIVYRILPENVVKVFQEFGPIPIEDIQANYLRRAAKEATNDVGTQYDLFSLMGPKRLEASQRLTESLRKRLAPSGISVDIAMLGTCYPTQEFQSKITSRVNSYIELEISRLKRDIADIERQVAVVKGEANNQASQLTASQAKDRSIEILKLEADEMALKKWDGNLPSIATKPGQTVIVSDDSLAKMGARR